MNVFSKTAAHVIWVLALVSLLVASQVTAQNVSTSGRLECTVFVVDSQGRSVVPGAKIAISGPTELTSETDAEGKCLFPAVPPGTYAIEAQFPGLEAAQFVTVNAGAVTQVSL